MNSVRDAILSAEMVLKLIPMSRTQLWRIEKRGEFPKRVHFGQRRVGWRESEILRWISERN